MNNMAVTLNQGSKTYQESITHKIGGLQSVINLCPTASNIIVEIPLFKTSGVHIISPSLIYNFQLRNSGGLFGGTKFNYFPTLYKNGNDIYVNNPDGSIDYYDGYDTINPETYASISYSNPGRDTYTLVDKFSNRITYLDTNYSIPDQIICKNGKTLNILSSSNIPSKLANTCGDEIVFFYNTTYINQIHYKKNNVILYKIYLYQINNKLSSIEIKRISGNEETLLSHYTITEANNTLTLKDEILNYSYTYTFNNDGQITSFYDSYYPEKITYLTYSNTTTTITDIFNRENKYYFSNGLPCMTMNYLGYMHENSYDYNGKRNMEENIVPISAPFTNLLPVGINGFQTSNAFFLESYSETDANYNFITNKYKITGNNGSAFYIINELGKYRDTVQFVFYTKIITGSDNNSFIATLSLGNQVDVRTVDLNYKEGYQMVSLEVDAKRDYTYISVSIECYGIVAVIGRLEVIRHSGVKRCNYHESNLTSYDSKYQKQDMTYNSNIVDSNIGTNLPSTNYYYNNHNCITKEEKPNLLDIHNTYNVYNQILTKESTDENSKIIKEEYAYNNDNLLQIKKDPLENETTYTYDSFGNILTETNPLDEITSYSYDSKMNLISITKDNNTINLSYNLKNKVTSISIDNGNTYNYEYNGNDNLESVSINDIEIGSYEYDTYGRIKSSSYGFSYTYTSDNLTSVSCNNNDLYTIEYDAKNRVEEIKDSNDNTIEEYVYDDEDKLEEKNIRELNIRYDYSVKI